MIGTPVLRFCSEDISLIENYYDAINDRSQVWHCHHKKEIELNKSRKELIELGLYYNRPASELIFLTPKEHRKIHKPWNKGVKGSNRGFWKDKHLTEETKIKISKSLKGKRQGDKNGFYGHKQTEEAKEKNRIAHTGIKQSEQTKEKRRKSMLGKNAGKKCSDETKKKISIAKSNKKWISNGETTKVVSLNELDYYLSRGYHLGRK